MVHPYLYETANVPAGEDPEEWVSAKVLPKVKSLLDRIHVAVLGPGLGRDELMLSTVEAIIEYLRSKDIPIILDADALFLISQKPEIIQGYSNAIVTPNVAEFKRLAQAMGVQHDDPGEETKSLSKALGVTVMRKGGEDLIAHGDNLIKSSIRGSNRRAGGQGDTLTGTIATLIAWGNAYKQQLWKHDDSVPYDQMPLIACFGGSCVTRLASRLAFQKVGRAMQATDVHSNVGEAYQLLIEKDDFKL